MWYSLFVKGTRGFGRFLSERSTVKRTFKEKAVSGAARITKKYRFLKPIVFLGLGIVLGFFGIGKYFYSNGKRYITLGICVLFFLMSSSFATPDQANDNEIYLSNISADEVNIYDTDVSLDAGDFIDSDSADELTPDTLVDDEVIVSGDLFTFEEEKQLESTENIDKFTIDDLYADAILSDSTVSSDSSLSGFDKDAWYMILVNKTHPVPDDYEVKLTTLKGDMKCDERVLEPLKEMLNGAKADGIDLIVCSPYRDYQLQERLFLRKINAYMDLGMSYLESYKLAAQKVIMPGASEHQLGIAFDIVVNYHAVLDYEFGDTPAGKWLIENCADYGFILRYPRGKEEITGIEYEPWHFRYVGKDAAAYIMENELTLEEFLDNL